MTQPLPGPVRPRRLDSVRALLARLVEPSERTRLAYRRRARFLAWLLLMLMGLTVLSLPLTAFSISPADPRGVFYLILDLAVLGVFALAYALNWRGHYDIAAGLMVGCVVLGVWASILIDPTILLVDPVSLLFTAFAVLLCSLLLSPRTTTLLAAGQLAALVALLRLNAAAVSYGSTSLIVFYCFTVGLCIVASMVSQRDMQQIELQSAQLLASAALLQEQSIRDALTGLYNRRFLDEVLPHELSRVARTGRTLAVMLIDLDGFKLINDTLGHARGDALLRDIGRLFRHYIRKTDYACRYGGDEFVLILPEAPLRIACVRAEYLRAHVAEVMSAADHVASPVSLSIGLAMAPEAGETSEAILKSADDALYQAKRQGRNQIVVSVPAITASANREALLP